MKKGFGEQKCLSKPSLCNTEGEHIGLIGANGEGKATFMNIVTGQ